MDIAILIITIAPGIILLWYFYSRDKNREPKMLIARLFIWGVLALFPMAFFEIMLEDSLGFESIEPFWLSIFLISFASAALIEEFIKYVVVKKVAYKSPYFDEVMDGIVYAIVASLGMATLENILYVSDGGLGVAILRAVTAVPSHAFASGVMGYFIGLAKFAPNKSAERRLLFKGVFMAVLLHGLYDFFLFTETAYALLVLPLLFIEYRMVHQYVKLAHQQNSPDTLSLSFIWHDIRKFSWVGLLKILIAIILITFGLFMALVLSFTYMENEININDFLSGISFGVALPWLFAFIAYRGRKKNLKQSSITSDKHT